MKIKIAVTDACIFIDLYDLGLVNSFFDLELEIHTTTSVYFELYEEQQQVLKAYQSIDSLIVHNLLESDFLQIHSNHSQNLYRKQINRFYTLPIN